MPPWLRVVARLDPLSHLVDALRSLLLDGATSAYGLGLDFAVEVLFLLGLVALAARLYPTVAL